MSKRLNSLGLPIYHTRTWGVTITTRMFPRKEICKNETRKRVFWNSVSCHKHFLCDIFYSGDTITKRRCDSVGQGEITAIFLLLGFRTECKFLRRSILYWALSRVFVGLYSLYRKHSTKSHRPYTILRTIIKCLYYSDRRKYFIKWKS